MRLEELDFAIPPGLIAQRPVEPRDSCRLMWLQAGGGRRHSVFSDLPGHLLSGDTLVFNDTRVLPARVEARRATGGAVELLFLHHVADADVDAPTNVAWGDCWEVLAKPSHRLRESEELVFPGGERLRLQSLLGEGRWLVTTLPGHSLVETMEAYGRLPLPPYIKAYPDEPSAYQTVYARAPGSAAAPTAGLHFTPGLLQRLRDAGIRLVYVTLHVGLDTFQPIREAVVEDHRIHRETYSVSPGALGALREAIGTGSRLVTVGTTATRVLETLAQTGALSGQHIQGPVTGSTNIFITPGYRFRATSALLTNFHLPRSSVLALTMAFAGVARLREAYAEAVAMKYRFFSFGDAMLIDGVTEPGVSGRDMAIVSTEGEPRP